MWRYVTAILSRRWKKPLRKSPMIRTDNSVVRLPPNLYIPASKERASLYRKISAIRTERRKPTSNVVEFPSYLVNEISLPGRTDED